jgi:transketolase
MENRHEDSKLLNHLRRDILLASSYSHEGHVPSAFSILDILFCLYLHDSNSSDYKLSEMDYKFILSKGHASLSLYAVLSEAGFFEKDWIESFGRFNSRFGGHPDRNKVPGVVASTGSLGHGLPMGIGIALANRLTNPTRKTIVLLGDGELNEGSNWESLLLASHHHLRYLTIIIDYNHSTDRALKLGDLEAKLTSFGLVTEVIDGHNHIQILEALLKIEETKPRAVIARTIKGKGLKEMENNPEWHHASPSKEKLSIFLSELSI